MKLTSIILLPSALTYMGFVPLLAQGTDDPFSDTGDSIKSTQDDDSTRIRLLLEYVEMPMETMAELLADPKLSASDVALKKKVDALVKEKKAKLFEMMLATSRIGDRVSSESVKELIYPTEYEPPELPNTLTVQGGKPPLPDSATGPTPTSFDTRKLGAIFAYEVLASGGGFVDLKLNPDVVEYVGDKVWTEWRGRHGNADIKMPVMYSMTFQTRITTKVDVPTLVASLSPKDENGRVDRQRKVLVFAKVTQVETP